MQIQIIQMQVQVPFTKSRVQSSADNSALRGDSTTNNKIVTKFSFSNQSRVSSLLKQNKKRSLAMLSVLFSSVTFPPQVNPLPQQINKGSLEKEVLFFWLWSEVMWGPRRDKDEAAGISCCRPGRGTDASQRD